MTIEFLQKAATSIYITAEPEVAEEISKLLLTAASELSALQKENDKLRLRLEIFESSDHADGVVALCNTSVDLEYERDFLRTQNRELRSALESLKHADGCYCEAAFSGPDGSHPRHSDECVKASQALALQPEK